nr:MAG TPA: helix-turn-helix domain protein [Caudoviricetes sp.]
MKEITVEEAFELYENGFINKRKKITKAEAEEIYNLRKIYTPKELGKLLNKSDSSICHIVTKYREGLYG